MSDPSGSAARANRLSRPGAGRWAAACAAAVVAGEASAQPCANEWEIVGGGTDSAVRALTTWDDGTGPALYLGGDFSAAGGLTADSVAKWDGQSLSPLGLGTNNQVFDLAVYDDGLLGPQLYAVGWFETAGGVPVDSIARWDGQSWSAVGNVTPQAFRFVNAAAVFDDGLGDRPALYVGGDFTEIGGEAINQLARWDGASWSGVGVIDGDIEELAVFDDGTGPALYVGGGDDLISAGGVPVNGIAKWDGQSWSALGAGITGTIDQRGQVIEPIIQTMVLFDDGTGPALYVGGEFHLAGGQPANNVAKWDGTSWSTLGGGLNDDVRALHVYDDGSGPALYAGGPFTRADDMEADHLARWDGQAWSPVGYGLHSGTAFSMISFDDGTGVALYLGGRFAAADGAPANNIARWTCNPVGACCLPSGECEMLPEQTCRVFNGLYNGDGVDCASVSPCPQPFLIGACCLPTGCELTWIGTCAELGGLYLGDGSLCGDCPSFAAGEMEPNNTKVDVDPILLAEGDTLAGVTTGNTGQDDPLVLDYFDTASPDYFRIQTTPAPLGIYRHHLVLTNPTTPGNTPSLRFHGQENPTSGAWPCELGRPTFAFNGHDAFGTAATTEPGGSKGVTWYGFGQEEQIFYRVDGDDTTTGHYFATLETTPISPIDIGMFQPGQISIQTQDTAGFLPTALCIFDENLDPIPGYFNNNATVAGGAPADLFDGSFLRRNYEPGTYHMAITVGDLVPEVGVPCDSASFTPIMNALTDFPDTIFSLTGSFFFDQTDVSFSVTDADGTTSVPATRGTGNDIAWFTFTVGGAPPHCAADLDGVGGVDVFDLLAYLDLWFAGDAAAELTGDSPVSVDVFDLLAYLDLWFAGC